MSESKRHPHADANDPDSLARATAEGVNVQPTVLREELDEAIRQRDECREQLRRAQADFLNFQKRSRSQAEAERMYAVAPLAIDLLAVLDNFERAIEAARQAGAESLITGLDMVYKQILDTLAKHGVQPIQSLDQTFDPNFHEALMQQPDSGRPDGIVVAELGRGYRLHDRVLRPSRVAVSVNPPQE